MTSLRRLLIISDVGGAETRHLGDEAMLEANLNAFRNLNPGIAITVVSRDPAWSAARYGVEAVAPFGFPRGPEAGAERNMMLAELLSDAVTGARKHATIEAVTVADGIVVSGGGNLSSTWPDLLYERITLLQLARIFGKPAVLLGQTLGPELSSDERQLLAESLSYARFVGLRELPSAVLALELGVPAERLWYQCDDALFAAGFERNPEPAAPARDHSGSSGIAITIDPQIRAAKEILFTSLVSQLRKLSKATGAPLRLIPHMFGNEAMAVPSDLTEASVLVDALGLSDTVIVPDLDAGRARQLTSDAALVISSRYHPIVFALAAGVPALGIYGDDYCRIKVQGALAHARLERWTVTYDAIVRGQLLERALELWNARAEVSSQLNSVRPVWAVESRERWAAVLHALDATKPIPPLKAFTMFGRPLADVAAALVSANEARRQWRQSERKACERLAPVCGKLDQSGCLENEIGMRESLSRHWSALRSKFKPF